MTTEVEIPTNFQYKFFRNEISSGGAVSVPLTPPVTGRRRQSMDSPLSRPRPRAGSDSSKYQRLSGSFQMQRESSGGSPKLPSIDSSVGKEYNPFNSSPSSATRKSFGPFPVESFNAVPKVKATFAYQKLDNPPTTDDFVWHFNQPNVFLDDTNNDNDDVDTEKQTKDNAQPITNDTLQYYEVVSRFLHRHDDEIDLNVGDKIAVTAKYPDLWFQGTNTVTGKHGIFPSLYVKEMPKPEKEIPTPQSDLLVTLDDQDKPPIPKRLTSLQKQTTEPIISSSKLDEIKTKLETSNEAPSLPPRLTKPPVVTRVKSPQTSVRQTWTTLDDDDDKPTALFAGLDNPGYIMSNDTKKDDSPELRSPAPIEAFKAKSVSPTISTVVARPSIKTRSFSVEDNESDYSEVYCVIITLW